MDAAAVSTSDEERVLADLEAGLDVLEAPPPRTGWRRRAVATILPPIVGVVLVLLVWQIAVAAHVRPRYELPSPTEVWSSLREQWDKGVLAGAVWTSVRRALVGFLASLVIGTLIGLVVARVRPVRTALSPVLHGLQALPSVAWVPAAIIWFGLTDAAIYFVVLLGAVPSVANGLVAGLDQIPPLYLRVGQTLGARRLTAVRHILLPAALPGLLAGATQGWAFAWRSLMAAELITFSPRLGLGLGQLLDSGRQMSDMSLVVAIIIAILVVGVAVDLLLFSPLERLVLGRRGLGMRVR